jgi:hypothetical protein
MPTIQSVIHLARTISTAVCESSFSSLKRILTPHRMSMLHTRIADLIAFERQLARQMQSDGQLVRRFWDAASGRRRLQLY